MDPFQARTMVETLSKGINPLTGRALPVYDSCANEEIQDALLEVLEHCSIESNEQYLIRLKNEADEKRALRKEEALKRYPRTGEKWANSEIEKLRSMHRNGYNIYKIANILKRTPNAISNRLKELQEQPIYRTKKK